MPKVTYYDNGLKGTPFPTNEKLIRSGIASEEFFEMTPVIFRGELLVVASVHPEIETNPYRSRCLWAEMVKTGDIFRGLS